MPVYNHSSSLSPKQLRFIDEYLVDLNGTAAAVRAGYSAKSARTSAQENMSKPAIQRALLKRQEGNARRLHITRQDVIKRILEGIEMAELMGQPDIMIRGLADIARMLGMYEPERHTVAANRRLEALSDAELAILLRD